MQTSSNNGAVLWCILPESNGMSDVACLRKMNQTLREMRRMQQSSCIKMCIFYISLKAIHTKTSWSSDFTLATFQLFHLWNNVLMKCFDFWIWTTFDILTDKIQTSLSCTLHYGYDDDCVRVRVRIGFWCFHWNLHVYMNYSSLMDVSKTSKCQPERIKDNGWVFMNKPKLLSMQRTKNANETKKNCTKCSNCRLHFE